MISNKLTVVAVERIPDTGEDEVPLISVIPVETVYLDKGYYYGVYVLLKFKT